MLSQKEVQERQARLQSEIQVSDCISIGCVVLGLLLSVMYVLYRNNALALFQYKWYGVVVIVVLPPVTVCLFLCFCFRSWSLRKKLRDLEKELGV